jgi:hypothetical protein
MFGVLVVLKCTLLLLKNYKKAIFYKNYKTLSKVREGVKSRKSILPIGQ